jgi:hypothetical protein
VVSAADPPRSLITVFYTGAATFLSSSSSFILTRAEWTPFQTHCYSENLLAPGIEPETSGSAWIITVDEYMDMYRKEAWHCVCRQNVSVGNCGK